MNPEKKKAVLKREVQKVSKEIIMEKPEVYVYSSISLEGIPDSIKKEISKMHDCFWKEMLQVIEARTGFAVVQASEIIDEPIHKCQ